MVDAQTHQGRCCFVPADDQVSLGSSFSSTTGYGALNRPPEDPVGEDELPRLTHRAPRRSRGIWLYTIPIRLFELLHRVVRLDYQEVVRGYHPGVVRGRATLGTAYMQVHGANSSSTSFRIPVTRSHIAAAAGLESMYRSGQ